MRYLKVLGLVALFFFSMLFFVQNHEVLISVITLKLEVFGMAYQTEAVPFYLWNTPGGGGGKSGRNCRAPRPRRPPKRGRLLRGFARHRR